MASAFEQVIRLQLGRYSPEAAQKMHVAIAKAGLAAELGGQLERPGVTIEVDGHAATSEDQVRPFGVITYRFSRMKQIAMFALAAAKQLSPVGTGGDPRPGHPGFYRNAWFALVNNAEIDVAAVPNDGIVTITNDAPYSRKINVGARGFERYAPPGVVEKVRQLVLAKYSLVITAEIVFLNLQGGYTLQNDLRKISKGKRYGGPRNDARRGAQITYPALVLTPKRFS